MTEGAEARGDEGGPPAVTVGAGDRLPQPMADAEGPLRRGERASAGMGGAVGARAGTTAQSAATAQGAATARGAAGTTGAATPTNDAVPALHAAEAWLVEAISSPGEPADVPGWVTAGPRLTAPERLEIYRYGYRARLVECLLDDYPGVAAALGTERFEALCHRYIERFPSASPSLNAFGRHLSALAESEGDAGKAPAGAEPFLAELARLEWTLVEMIHARAPARFDFGELTRIPSERWGDVVLTPSDTARVVRFAYPVNAWYQAWRTRGDAPAVPSPEPSATVVYRRDFRLWRMDLTPAMARVLEALFAGTSIGAALARMGPGETDPAALAEAERSVMVWFREWIDAGLFCGATLSDAT